ncbi:hypothetical protein B9Z55_012494 [Caenorhabditis nigoni]|uniref:DUF38 domain-containing protein n=1 Tax=Caenorhabditis nigoni TaxID=1611254 RepID=A0A2G5TXG4_9PELO|nr:hypothetical protein B9Z55_012494 [Caenorhabditis nigoni]
MTDYKTFESFLRRYFDSGRSCAQAHDNWNEKMKAKEKEEEEPKKKKKNKKKKNKKNKKNKNKKKKKVEKEEGIGFDPHAVPVQNIIRIFEKFAKQEFAQIRNRVRSGNKRVNIENDILRILYLRRISYKCRTLADQFQIANKNLEFTIGFNEINIKLRTKSLDYCSRTLGDQFVCEVQDGILMTKSYQTVAVSDLCYLIKRRADKLICLEFKVASDDTVGFDPDLSIYWKIRRFFDHFFKNPEEKIEVGALRFTFVSRPSDLEDFQIHSVLQYIKPKVLWQFNLQVWQTVRDGYSSTYKIPDTVTKTEQWQLATVLYVDKNIINQWKQYRRFSGVSVDRSLEMQDYMEITNAFVDHPPMRTLSIYMPPEVPTAFQFFDVEHPRLQVKQNRPRGLMPAPVGQARQAVPAGAELPDSSESGFSQGGSEPESVESDEPVMREEDDYDSEEENILCRATIETADENYIEVTCRDSNFIVFKILHQ